MSGSRISKTREVRGFSISNLQFTKRWYSFYCGGIEKYYQLGNILSTQQENIIGHQVGDQFNDTKHQQPVGISDSEIGQQVVDQLEVNKYCYDDKYITHIWREQGIISRIKFL